MNLGPLDSYGFLGMTVVPLAGTWIETDSRSESRRILLSCPLRARGLQPGRIGGIKVQLVVPLAGE